MRRRTGSANIVLGRIQPAGECNWLGWNCTSRNIGNQPLCGSVPMRNSMAITASDVCKNLFPAVQ